MRTAFHAQGFEPEPMSPEQFAALIKADVQRSKAIIDKAGIKVEQ